MKLIKYIYGFFAISALSNCTPHTDYNGDYLNGLNLSMGEDITFVDKRIKKVTAINQYGDNSTLLYTYTGGRLSKVESTEKDENKTYELIYNTDQQLSEVAINAVDENDQEVDTQLSLSYDTLGKLSQASGVVKKKNAEVSRSNTVFTYAGNDINKIVTTHTVPNSQDSTKYVVSMIQTSEITFDSSNISKWKTTIASYAPDNSTTPINVEVNETTITESDKYRNPYSRVGTSFLLLSIHFGGTSSGPLSLSSNNFVKTTVSTSLNNSTPTTKDYTFSYTYNNSIGYPILSFSNEGERIIYEYY